MPKISPKITAVLSAIALIYALFDNFNVSVAIASILVLVLSIGMIIEG
ncbi:MAG: hypothetical protein KKF50_02275 [Nanoarchaeota archaeon]|nr:hypothetical protein [Nanoarchaeota archaeon]